MHNTLPKSRNISMYTTEQYHFKQLDIQEMIFKYLPLFLLLSSIIEDNDHHLQHQSVNTETS